MGRVLTPEEQRQQILAQCAYYDVDPGWTVRQILEKAINNQVLKAKNPERHAQFVEALKEAQKHPEMLAWTVVACDRGTYEKQRHRAVRCEELTRLDRET